MIPYTAVCKYVIKHPLIIVWEYIEGGEHKSFNEKFDSKPEMNVKLDAFNSLVKNKRVPNYQR